LLHFFDQSLRFKVRQNTPEEIALIREDKDDDEETPQEEAEDGEATD
jgi:hypothetical protein